LIENGGVRYNFESGPPKDHIPKRNKLAEKISQKNHEYMLNYSLPCSCS